MMFPKVTSGPGCLRAVGCRSRAWTGWATVGLAMALSAAGAVAQDVKQPPSEYQEILRRARRQPSERGGRALLELRRAIMIYADDAEGWRELARLGLAAGDDEGALLAVHRALELAPKDAALSVLLGDVHARAGRRLAALWAYGEAERLAAAGGTLDAADRARIETWRKEAVGADAGAPEAAQKAGASRGRPARVLLRYLGYVLADGTRTDGSVEVGKPLVPGCLRALALDDQGFAVPTRFTWQAGAGLALDPATDPPALRAGDDACDATVTATVEGSAPAVAGTATVRTIGALAKIVLDPARKAVKAGEQVGLKATPVDSAGHRLWVMRFEWKVEPGDGEAGGAAGGAAQERPPAEIYRSFSAIGAGDFLQPHSNVVTVRPDLPAAAKAAFRVVATVPGGQMRGWAEFEAEGGAAGAGAAGPAAGQAAGAGGPAAGQAAGAGGPAGIPWLTSLDDAMAAGRTAQRPVLVEVMSEW